MDDRFEFARSRIIQQHRFFSVLMMSRKWEEDPNLQAAMATDGETVFYNVKACESFTHEELMGVMIHELFHIFGKHHLRMRNRDQETWSKSCDYAANPQLINMGVVLPKTVFLKKEFENKSAEEIYNILIKEKEDASRNEKNNSVGNGSGKGRDDSPKLQNTKSENMGGTGTKKKGNGKQELPKKAVQEVEEKAPDGGFDFIKPPKVLSKAEISEKETEINIVLSQAMRIAKQAGKFSGELERIFETLRETETDWTEELRNHIQVIAKNDYTWMYPNKRYIHRGLYLPSLRSIEIGKVVIVIDSSGSVMSYIKLYTEFMSQIRCLLEEMKTTATIIFCDSRVKSIVEDVYPEDIENLKIVGGGGTDFKPAFEYIDEQGDIPSVLIYFTDLECHSYPTDPDYPVIWAVYGGNKRNREVPFGQIIDLK